MKNMVSLPRILSWAGRDLPTPCMQQPHSLERDCVQIAESDPRRRESMVSILPVSGFTILPATVGLCRADWARRFETRRCVRESKWRQDSRARGLLRGGADGNTTEDVLVGTLGAGTMSGVGTLGSVAAVVLRGGSRCCTEGSGRGAEGGAMSAGVGAGWTARRRMSATFANALRMGGPKSRGSWWTAGIEVPVLCSLGDFSRWSMSSAVCLR
jgi:hypothetical protein